MNNNIKDETNIINEILRQTDQPNFVYDGSISNNKIYNYIKKHPINFSRITYLLSRFLCLYIIFLFLIQKNYKVSYSHRFIILLSFIISIVMTIIKIKKEIKKQISILNSKIYFYDNFFIIESVDNIENIPYNKILSIKESKNNFSILIKSKNLIIQKEEIDEKFSKFLAKLMINYKKIVLTTKDEQFWESTHKNMGAYKVYCINEKNEKTLNKFFNTKKIYIPIFIYFFICFSLIALYIYYIFGIVYNTPSKILLFTIFVFILTKVLLTKLINEKKLEMIKSPQEKIYLYDKYLIIKNKEKIVKYNYDKIKYFIEDNELIYIPIKLFSLVLIINKTNPDLKK